MSCLRRGENDLLTWCNNNAERGKQLISEFQGETDTEEILDMTDVSYASHTKLKWKCKNNHIFYQTAGARTVSKYNCPYCGHETLESYIQRNAEYGLQLRNEYTGIDDQGNKVGMDQITTGSSKRMQWKCKNGHTWYTSVSHRTTSKSQCPYCTTDNTSYPEQYIFFALKNIYPDTQNRGILFKDDINKRGMEYDVVIPSIRLLIEYNGYKFHKEKEERDILKRKISQQNTISVEAEPPTGYTVVGWRTSTSDPINPDYNNWEGTIPGVVQANGASNKIKGE